MKNLSFLVISVTCLLVTPIGVVGVAQAGEQDFQYGMIARGYICHPQYGADYDIVTYSNIITYCPYGPQPNWEQDAESAMQQAAQSACALGQVTHSARPAWYGAMSKANAEKAHATVCTYQNGQAAHSCQLIAWTPSTYSTYNNPANCHP